jgi:hypothetical protein
MSFELLPMIEDRFSLESRRSLESKFSTEENRSQSLDERDSHKTSSETSERHLPFIDSNQSIDRASALSEGKLTENERYVVVCPPYETVLHPTDILFVLESSSLKTST